MNSNLAPLRQLCRDLITMNRTTLDNFEQLVNAWPDGGLGATPAGGGARGARITSPATTTRARSRHRSRGARGARALGADVTSR